MARVKLTAGRIRDFTVRPDQQQSFLWDTEAPWLAVRATASAKVYIFQSLVDGKSLRIRIGDTDAWDIDKARTEARNLQILIDKGIDPREAKAEQAEAKRQAQAAKEAEAQRQAAEKVRQAITVSVAWHAYLQARAPRWSAHHLRDHKGLAATHTDQRGGRSGGPGPIAALLPLRLADLTADALATWQTTEAATRPGSAALAYRLARAFLRWCAEQPAYKGLVDPAAVLTKRVREAVPSVKAKDDCLQREQLTAWFAAVRQHPNAVIATYLQTALLTGARREELAGLKWEDLNFQWHSLSIRDKVDGERTIPLTPYVATLLAALPRRNQWVFSSPTAASGRLQEPRIAHNRALAAAGLPDLTLHGLRRSFGTLAEWTECPVGVTAQIMGHKPSALAEKHYRRRPLDLLRKWHTAIERFILDEAGIAQPQADAPAPRLRVVA
jgi:integrase